ncbi:trypsin-like peptidase domain-containing protein [Streptomyces sp. NBC_01190]|uniref:S1C family serine protease n=1 Tax=Streptomyces sp. NBC_01190 TaxID=2903767 RepID=UPI00386FF091|nr:trypsin-like peptidase domain-containing protein [Streptomyces sp. NBC_01190]
MTSSPAPIQAPPPVGPPSPYGAPPSALAGSGAGRAGSGSGFAPGAGAGGGAGAGSGAGSTPDGPAPSPSPYQPPAPGPYQPQQPEPTSPFEPPRPAPSPYDPQQPAPSPYEPPRPAFDAQKPSPYDSPAAPASPPAPPSPSYDSPAPSYGSPRPAYGAESAGHGQPQDRPGAPTSVPDPYAVPATPAYATSSAQPGGDGYGGGGPVWGAQFPAAPNPADGGRRRRGAGLLIVAVVVAALVAGGVGSAIGYNAAKNDDNSSSTTVSAPKDAAALNRAPTSVAGIANKALPSVVTIKASGSQESGTGTGFVYDTQGHILTNNHVVAPAADGGKLTVTFSNGNTYDAEVIGRAQGYDVAVVKLKNPSGVKLTPLPLGNSDQAAVGDATIAIGAPFGLSGTVTTGIVSAVHRPVASSDGQGSTASYMSAIQTDASINPGNSGGPLLNADGAVIGINSAIQPGGATEPGTQGGSVGLGFAIPINQAQRVAQQLIRTGQPVYPVIGVSLDTQFDGDGAKISTDTSSAITSGGPGAKAGLRPGDVITKFDDTIIDSGQTLIGEIWQHQPGDKATLTYTRGSATHTTTVTLGSRTGDSGN